MRVIIAGSRNAGVTVSDVDEAVKKAAYYVTQVVSGRATGADRAGEEWALKHHIPVRHFEVFGYEWEKSIYAGHRRNERMAKYAHALIALWDGQSAGTENMIRVARAHRLLVYVHRIGGT